MVSVSVANIALASVKQLHHRRSQPVRTSIHHQEFHMLSCRTSNSTDKPRQTHHVSLQDQTETQRVSLSKMVKQFYLHQPILDDNFMVLSFTFDVDVIA